MKNYPKSAALKVAIFLLSILLCSVSAWAIAADVSGTKTAPKPADSSNVRIENGVQIIQIDAKRGYTPRVSQAKANVPTTIIMNTKSTFDCSSALVIRDLNYHGRLPPTGLTKIVVPAEKATGILRASCSMGMYGFAIEFK